MYFKGLKGLLGVCSRIDWVPRDDLHPSIIPVVDKYVRGWHLVGKWLTKYNITTHQVTIEIVADVLSV